MTSPDPDTSDLADAINDLREQLNELASQSEFQAAGLSSLESNLTSIAVAMTDQPVTDDTEPADTPTASRPRRPAAATDGDDKESVLSEIDNGAPNLELLRPWVIANLSGWCERTLPTTAGGEGARWCSRWFEHPEAITRLWALRAQQLIAAEEGASALSAYLRDHFDHHIGVLTASTGPFHKCAPDKHEPSTNPDRRFLPTQRAPLRVVAN